MKTEGWFAEHFVRGIEDGFMICGQLLKYAATCRCSAGTCSDR